MTSRHSCTELVKDRGCKIGIDEERTREWSFTRRAHDRKMNEFWTSIFRQICVQFWLSVNLCMCCVYIFLGSATDKFVQFDLGCLQLYGIVQIFVISADKAEGFATEQGTCLLEQITLFVALKNYIVHPCFSFASAYIDETVNRSLEANQRRSLADVHVLAYKRWREEHEFCLFSYRSCLGCVDIGGETARLEECFPAFITIADFLHLFCSAQQTYNPYFFVLMKRLLAYGTN